MKPAQYSLFVNIARGSSCLMLIKCEPRRENSRKWLVIPNRWLFHPGSIGTVWAISKAGKHVCFTGVLIIGSKITRFTITVVG